MKIKRIYPPGFRLGHTYEVLFSQTGEYLLSLGEHRASLWNVHSKKRLHTVNLSYVNHGTFSPDDSRYAIKNVSGEIIVLKLPRGEIVDHYVPSTRDEGSRIEFSADGEFIV